MRELDAILRLPTAARVLAESCPIKAITRPTDNANRAEAEKFTSSIIRDLLPTLQVTSRPEPRNLFRFKQVDADMIARRRFARIISFAGLGSTRASRVGLGALAETDFPF